MKFKKIIGFILVVFLILWPKVMQAADIPPLLPAKIAGYVSLNGQLLKGEDGYSVKADVKGIKINGKIDSEGRYALFIPDNVGIEPWDNIYVSLYSKDYPVSSSKFIEVPDFGAMKIVNLEF